ncbi:hypothetical protein [Acinetobacter sp. A47]|uniref:hypothetical protein n=1 Tax=Acinetobacter sp. A47 TaxID=1561217 RepID=UPI001269F329|nr:hypothetical protein [Acinetobacter sp. A47]
MSAFLVKPRTNPVAQAGTILKPALFALDLCSMTRLDEVQPERIWLYSKQLKSACTNKKSPRKGF